MRIRVRTLLASLAAVLAILVVLLLAWAAALAAFGISRAPAVAPSASVAPKDIERALQLLKRHDPRWQRPGIIRAVVAEERDINLLLEHAAARLPGLRGQARLLAGGAEVRLSIDLARWGRRLSGLPGRTSAGVGNGSSNDDAGGVVGRASGGSWWLNLEARLGPANGLPELQRLRIGPVPVPTFAAGWAARYVLYRYAPGLDLRVLEDVIRRVDLRRGHALVFYAWQDDTSGKLLEALTPAAEQQRLRAYAERLARWSRDEVPGGWAVPLPQLLKPLFELAQQRIGAGADALTEARAALFTAMLYANRRSIAAVVPAARSWPRPRWLIVTLYNRADTPLHYLISASLAAESGSPLADAVGLYKELADARPGGSGFSFNDLAADRAGTRVGELAQRDPHRLLDALARVTRESELLPDVADLPESLTQAQFEARYGGAGAPAYARMVAEIDARLDVVPLLR